MIRLTSGKVLSPAALAFLLAISSPAQTQNAPPSDAALQARIAAQIATLNREKKARTPVQRKIASSLLFALQQRRGSTTLQALRRLNGRVAPDANNRVLVEIQGRSTVSLANRIRNARGVVGQSWAPTGSGTGKLRARLALSELEAIAAQPEVRFIRPAQLPHTRQAMTAPIKVLRSQAKSKVLQQRLQTLFPARQVLPRATDSRDFSTGSSVSEGVTTHLVNKAREQFGVGGVGVKIGVISDSVDFLQESQSAGELPAVTVLPGQGGITDTSTGEGTAMLEIVHDMAPQAQLFFATSGASQEQFAKNVRALRSAGCDIIVDDIFFYDESPFEYGPIHAAIRDVTRSGALYFSAAGNSGNLNDGTSGTWEGNFKGAQTEKEGLFHNWDRSAFNRLKGYAFALTLQWNDRLGQARNDYDLYVFNSSGQIVGASNDDQTGAQDPFEMLEGANAGNVVVVTRFSGENRYLRLMSYYGALAYATASAIGDHNSIPECVSVGAVSALTAFPASFVGGAQNPVTYYSSDGPRRLFFDENGASRLIAKPDMVAADTVRTSVPGFFRFLGTSAAAPHAAAIAALIKSYNLSLKSADIRKLMARTALDIEQPGLDRDAGAGITMALQALQTLQREDQIRPNLTLATPAYNASLSRLERISGSVQDENSGVARVDIFLQRDRDNRYWSGKNWSISPIPLRPVSGGSTYTLTENLPGSDNLLAGGYTIFVAASDRAGNRSVISSRVRVPDTLAPILTIDSIERDATGARIVRVRGKLTDEPRGSGPARVLLFLRRARDGQYWNGTAWTSTSISLETTLLGNSNARAWELSSGWPTTPPTTASEVYYITVIGFDAIGNRATVTKSVVLQGQTLST